MPNSTIAAVSTPVGEGGIGIVRISGDEAFLVADTVFKSKSGKTISEIAGYSALFGKVYDGEEFIDTAIAIKFCAPKSYTGENTVELSVHGGSFVLNKLLRAVLKAGATPAGAGEFTKRAFLNGKLDLTEAESVMAIISAENDAQLRMANAALSGKVSQKIKEIEEILLSTAASVAVYSDYPEEYLPELEGQEFFNNLNHAVELLDTMLNEYDIGVKIKNGIKTAILGKPNVGKSTLMNLISGAEKSIVTSVAGTTRDVLEETVNIKGTMLLLYDTAGIHETNDEVEKIGVMRSIKKIEECDIFLCVFDTSVPICDDDIKLIEKLQGKTCIAVLNKSDIKTFDYTPYIKDMPFVLISAKDGIGKNELLAKIEELAKTGGFKADSGVLLNQRQYNSAHKARNAVNDAINARTMGLTTDAVGICIDEALTELYALTGKRVTNEVADEVFRNFCVGK